MEIVRDHRKPYLLREGWLISICGRSPGFSMYNYQFIMYNCFNCTLCILHCKLIHSCATATELIFHCHCEGWFCQTKAICRLNRLLLPINRDRNDQKTLTVLPYNFPLSQLNRDWNTVNFVQRTGTKISGSMLKKNSLLKYFLSFAFSL